MPFYTVSTTKSSGRTPAHMAEQFVVHGRSNDGMDSPWFLACIMSVQIELPEIAGLGSIATSSTRFLLRKMQYADAGALVVARRVVFRFHIRDR